MSATIHIVDDDVAVRAALSYLLTSHGYPTQIYASGTEFLQARQFQPGCVLLDLRMDGASGLEVLEELSRRGFALPIIAMSGEDNMATAIKALKLGAVDFVQKPCESSELVVAIEGALDAAGKGAQRRETRNSAAAQLRTLSPRERQILRGLVAGMTNKEIARRLDLSPRTVEMHRSNLIRDLRLRNTSDAIRLAIEAELTPLEAEDGASAPSAAALAPPSSLQAAKRPPKPRRGALDEILPPVLDVLEGTTDGVFLLDRDFNFTYLNRHALETVADDRELIGSNVWHAFPGAARTRAFDELKVAAEERKSVRFDFYEPDLARWFDVNARPIPSGLQVFFRDFSPERSAFAELKQSEERLRLALEASGDGAWDWDLASGRIEMSRRYLSQLGYDRHDDIPHTIDGARHLIHPADLPEVQRQLEEHLAGQSEIFACEYRIRLRRGGWRWSFDRGRVVARDPGSGKPTRMVGTATDISWLKEMRAKADEANERIALAQEGAGSGIWDLDLRRRRVRMCARTRDMHGISDGVGAVMAESVWAATVHPDDLARTMTALGEAAASGSTYAVKYRAILPGGEYRWLFALGKRLAGGGGMPNRFVGIVIDQTEHEQSARELARVQDELANVCRLTAMGTVASSLAHELNQPLTALMNYAGGLRLAAARAGLADQGQGLLVNEAIEGVQSSAMLVSQIIGRLHEPSKWTRIELQPESLSEIAVEAARVSGCGVDVGFEIPAEADGVRVDRVHIQQVIINLVRNAADAMRETGGRDIVISAVRASEAEVEIRVSDKGGGIAEAVRDRLFSPFVTTKTEGTGIGLSICRTIVEAHGGRIRALDRPGGGTQFAFTVPSA